MAAAPASAHAQLLLGMQIDLECLAADRHAPAVEQTNPAARSPVTDVTEDAQPSGFLTEELLRLLRRRVCRLKTPGPCTRAPASRRPLSSGRDDLSSAIRALPSGARPSGFT